KSWSILMKEIETHDGDSVEGYVDEINTLLLFAGLFSAVLTAFIIESYKGLQRDPSDDTIQLLTRISQQLGNQAGPAPSKPSPFSPSNSVIRINTFWFSSLVVTLVDALFGLLCKQWLREHRRHVNTSRPGDAFTLRWLRNQSFEKWHVRKILAFLPVLLEVALFFFFAGLLEVLWNLHKIPFALAMGIIGFAVLVYLVTTFLPVVMIGIIFQQASELVQARVHSWKGDSSTRGLSFLTDGLPPIQFLCPFKSPQSWAVFKLSYLLFRSFWHLSLSYFNKVQYLELLWTELPDLYNLLDWSAVDLIVMQNPPSYPGVPNMYELKGLRWLVTEFRDSESMRSHLQNVL
ncbi:hypothetical protein L218DRAFT_843189, partial [Marasmius fiardii PR-910]